MKKVLRNSLLLTLGWLCVVLGVIGIFLPIVPTTPFLILALTLFSKSSPRFHRMLLNNPWFGPTLKQWEESKTLPREIKFKASFLIVVTFTVSIVLLNNNSLIQWLLLCVAAALLFWIWRIKEPDRSNLSVDDEARQGSKGDTQLKLFFIALVITGLTSMWILKPAVEERELIPQYFVQKPTQGVEVCAENSDFRSQYSDAQNLMFMTADTSDLPTQTVNIFWDIERIKTALSYYARYKRYANTRFPSLKLESNAAGSKCYDLQSTVLKQLRTAMTYELTWGKEGALPKPRMSEQATTEQQLNQKVRNFQTVVADFLTINTAFSELGFDKELDEWKKTTRSDALTILRAADELVSSNLLYLPQNSAVSGADSVLASTYGITSENELSNYLARQEQRVSFIAETYVLSALNYLINTSPTPGSRVPIEQSKWQATLQELQKASAGDLSNRLVTLTDLFRRAFDMTIENCPHEIEVPNHDDIFTSAQLHLSDEIMRFCGRKNN